MKRKIIILTLSLAIATLNIYCQEIFAKNNTNTHIFYKTYKINVPNDNYIIISMRGFAPNNILVLDMNANDMRIYSPYEYNGLLLQRKLTKGEINSILAIFESKEYINVPERNNKVALDAEEIDITSIIKGRKKHIHHIMPDTRIIRRIIRLYNRLNVVPRK